jgi:hypothetical protein
MVCGNPRNCVGATEKIRTPGEITPYSTAVVSTVRRRNQNGADAMALTFAVGLFTVFKSGTDSFSTQVTHLDLIGHVPGYL